MARPRRPARPTATRSPWRLRPTLTVKLEWVGAEIDLDVVVIDGTGAAIDDAATSANPEEVTAAIETAGDYYVIVYSYEGAAAAAIEYTLTLTVP